MPSSSSPSSVPCATITRKRGEHCDRRIACPARVAEPCWGVGGAASRRGGIKAPVLQVALAHVPRARPRLDVIPPATMPRFAPSDSRAVPQTHVAPEKATRHSDLAGRYRRGPSASVAKDAPNRYGAPYESPASRRRRAGPWGDAGHTSFEEPGTIGLEPQAPYRWRDRCGTNSLRDTLKVAGPIQPYTNRETTVLCRGSPLEALLEILLRGSAGRACS